ncbi:MAG: IS1 family transposase [Desulfococcaceae bacterium]
MEYKNYIAHIEYDAQADIFGSGSKRLICLFKYLIIIFMKQYIQITCRHCGSDDPVRNGHSPNGKQRYLCNNCKKSLRTEYSCNACKPGVREQIGKQTLNSSGVRDISRNLQISKNTVISELKKKILPG